MILQQKILNYFEKLSLVYFNDKPTRTEKRMRQAGVLVGKSMQQYKTKHKHPAEMDFIKLEGKNIKFLSNIKKIGKNIKVKPTHPNSLRNSSRSLWP